MSMSNHNYCHDNFNILLSWGITCTGRYVMMKITKNRVNNSQLEAYLKTHCYNYGPSSAPVDSRSNFSGKKEESRSNVASCTDRNNIEEEKVFLFTLIFQHGDIPERGRM